jgi:hypothetical protein
MYGYEVVLQSGGSLVERDCNNEIFEDGYEFMCDPAIKITSNNCVNIGELSPSYVSFIVTTEDSGDFLINGKNVDLVLQRGVEYRFDQSHDSNEETIMFSNGSTDLSSNTGTPGNPNAYTTLIIPYDAPETGIQSNISNIGVISPPTRLNVTGNMNVSGLVGIGETNPTQLIHVRGTGPQLFIEGATNENAIIRGSAGPSYRDRYHEISMGFYALQGFGSNNYIDFNVNEGGQSNPGTRMRIRGDGRVGIGTTSPGYALHVIGDIYASGNVTAYSDVRNKKNLKTIEDPVSKIEKINGYTYEKDGIAYTGLVAQELLEVLPEAVSGSEELGYGIAYGNMAGIFVEAIKELNSKIKTLEKEINYLRHHQHHQC